MIRETVPSSRASCNSGYLRHHARAPWLRWHRALLGDEILPTRARDKLFEPRIPEPGSDNSHGYGWSIGATPDGRLAWHDGGNGWSLGLLSRSLRDGVLVFWVSNHAYRDGKWNLEDQAQALTLGIADRVRAEGH
jgi:hypothetical protein